MNTEQLRTFLAIAETGSFTAAANQMIVVQSTISKRIFELERELGQALFERGRAGVRLTQSGKTFLEYAGRIVNIEQKAIAEVNRTARFDGHLVVGTVYAYFDVCLKERLKRFMARHPEFSVRVAFGHTSRVLAEGLEGRADIVYAHHPYDHPEYACELVEEDDVVLVADGTNREYCGGVPFDEVRHLPIIASNFLYASTHDWLFPKDQQFQLEVDIAAHVLPFLRGSSFYTLLARKMVERQLAAGELIEIPILGGSIPPVRYYRIMRKDSADRPVIRAWRALDGE